MKDFVFNVVFIIWLISITIFSVYGYYKDQAINRAIGALSNNDKTIVNQAKAEFQNLYNQLEKKANKK